MKCSVKNQLEKTRLELSDIYETCSDVSSLLEESNRLLAKLLELKNKKSSNRKKTKSK